MTTSDRRRATERDTRRERNADGLTDWYGERERERQRARVHVRERQNAPQKGDVVAREPWGRPNRMCVQMCVCVCAYVYICVFMCVCVRVFACVYVLFMEQTQFFLKGMIIREANFRESFCLLNWRWVATIRRLPTVLGLFLKRALLLWGSFANINLNLYGAY